MLLEGGLQCRPVGGGRGRRGSGTCWGGYCRDWGDKARSRKAFKRGFGAVCTSKRAEDTILLGDVFVSIPRKIWQGRGDFAFRQAVAHTSVTLYVWFACNSPHPVLSRRAVSVGHARLNVSHILVAQGKVFRDYLP